MENTKTKTDELKQLLLVKKEERGKLEAQVEFVIDDINGKIKRLSELTTGNSQIKLLPQQQITECQATVNSILDKTFDINQSINKTTTDIKATEIRATDYEKQNREYEFYNKCFEEEKWRR